MMHDDPSSTANRQREETGAKGDTRTKEVEESPVFLEWLEKRRGQEVEEEAKAPAREKLSDRHLEEKDAAQEALPTEAQSPSKLGRGFGETVFGLLSMLVVVTILNNWDSVKNWFEDWEWAKPSKMVFADGQTYIACKGSLEVTPNGGVYELKFTGPDGVEHHVWGIRKLETLDGEPCRKPETKKQPPSPER